MPELNFGWLRIFVIRAWFSEFWQSQRVTCCRKEIANCTHRGKEQHRIIANSKEQHRIIANSKEQHRIIANSKEQDASKFYVLSSGYLGQTIKQDMFQIYFDLC